MIGLINKSPVLTGAEQVAARLFSKEFPEGRFLDIKGLCKVATISDIKKQGWSLNPGRYVGVADEEDDGVDYRDKLSKLNKELYILKI